MDFDIGDRVELIRIDDRVRLGEQGIIVTMNNSEPPIGIRWDESRHGRHTCHNHCENGYGWFVYERNIRLVNNNETIVQYAQRILERR